MFVLYRVEFGMENVAETMDREFPTLLGGVSRHLVSGINQKKQQDPKINVHFTISTFQEHSLSNATGNTTMLLFSDNLPPSVVEFAAANVVFQ